MITIFAGIIMLGILVFVHELGHFAVAKMSGVKVLKFSLGFGPRLLSRQWGETEYLICAIPLGGYVQMLGEGTSEAGEAVELSPEDQARSFANKPVSKRTAIVAAGPLMNLLLPFLVLPIAYMIGVNIPAYLEQVPCIGYVVTDSPGGRSGFESGDCIEAINGDAVATWTDANHALIAHVGSSLEFRVARANHSSVLTMNPEEGGLEGLQSLGLLPRQEAIVGALAPGMPAQAAGMEVGDRIVSIADSPVGSWYDLKHIIQKGGGEPQTFVLDRNGQQLTLSIKPVRDDVNGIDFLVGIAPQPDSIFKRFGIFEAVRAGADRTFELIELTLVFIQKMVSGHVSTKNIGGPITVVQIAGQAAQTDLSSILTVLAFLSIQLGILNLLPIPILDGGHLFFNLYEFVFRRPLSLRSREIAQQIGLLLLISLMILAFYNDIVRIFFGGQ
ncbi:MAG: RIP metalloprotease RseP [Desulfuromonadaceae bacterium GWC2_58_13]|nr:MAG: RIP metalloprotease RseP [Desulfuromonadaceae bacterium GWC2_58_13]